MPPPPLVSMITICGTFNTSDKSLGQGQQLDSNNRNQSPSLVTTYCLTTSSLTDINSLLEEIKVLREKLSLMDSLVEENKKLREKILSTEDEIFYLRNTLISKC